MNKINTEKIIIKFLGDSGDGIQLIGNLFSDSSVRISGNDIYTFVDFPSEIRAPSGSLSGISGFQVAISNKKLYTIEDKVDILVAFNPAALKIGIKSLKFNGILIIDEESFNDKNLKRAGFVTNPLIDNSLISYNLLKVSITKLTYDCVKLILPILSKARKCKNFFVLGLICWICDRKIDGIILWLNKKFKNEKDVFLANLEALKAGYNYGHNLEVFQNQFFISSSKLYDSKNCIKMSGNKAFVIGAITTSILMELPLFSANYPITPASDILHELSLYLSENIKIFQLEDEIAAINSVIGAAYGGALAFTCTSGPGLDLIQEGLGLAVMAELPIVVLDIQRVGPSTGIPTKSEQTDLLAAVFGRHGECPVLVLSPTSPVDCFWTILEGFILSIFYLGPVIILSDANLANSSELWDIPSLINIKKKFDLDFSYFKISQIESNNYKHWVVAGKSKIKCIGGLEKDIKTGDVSHDNFNHFEMVKYRNTKFKSMADKFLKLEVVGEKYGNVLLISWGSVCGTVRNIYENIKSNYSVSFLCLRYLNPLPNDLKSILDCFKKILVIEENLGQLAFILRSNYLLDIISLNQVSGKPFEIEKLKLDIIKFL